MCAKRKKRLLPQSWLALLFRQPPQGFYHAPAVYLSGGRMEVEHFCRILAYSPDRLCLQMPHGRLTIYGDGLKIVTLTASRRLPTKCWANKRFSHCICAAASFADAAAFLHAANFFAKYCRI